MAIKCHDQGSQGQGVPCLMSRNGEGAGAGAWAGPGGSMSDA